MTKKTSKKLPYQTSPAVLEAREVLARTKDLYTYGLFDVLKLGLPSSEQLSKALTKVTKLTQEIADKIDKDLRVMDQEENLARSEGDSTISPDRVIKRFYNMLADSFSRTDSGFVGRAVKLGIFIFPDKDRNEYFKSELERLQRLFKERELLPYMQKYNLK